jgi:hypothetical protein
MLELVGQITGSIEGIKQRAIFHLTNIEKEEKEDREKLGIKEK